LRAHELACVARRTEVCVLERLRALLAPAHLTLVQSVASCDRVLISRHSYDFAFFEHGAAHSLLGLLAAGRRIDHLLRLEEKLVHRRPTAHPMHIVRIDRHFLRVDELIDQGLAVSG